MSTFTVDSYHMGVLASAFFCDMLICNSFHLRNSNLHRHGPGACQLRFWSPNFEI